MQLRIEHLRRAEEQGTLAAGQADTLWQNLGAQQADEPAFKLGHIIYYFGAMLMLLPLTLYVGPALLRMDEGSLFFLASVLAGAAFALGDFLRLRGWRIPAGIFGCVAVALVPLVSYFGLKMLGADFRGSYRNFHQLIDARWAVIELLTLAAAAGALWRIREPLLVLPVAVALWYLGLDFAEGLAGHGSFSSDVALRYTQVFGLAMLGGAYSLERRTLQTLRDYTFWLWIFGTVSLWGALTAEHSGIEWRVAVYAAINVSMIVVGGLVGRRVLAVFGGAGAAWYLWHLCDRVFADSAVFPVIVMGIGAGLVWLAMRWPKVEVWLSEQGRGRVKP